MLGVLLKILAAVVLVFASLWAAGVFVYAAPFSPAVSTALAIVLAVVAVPALVGLFARRLRPALYGLGVLLVLALAGFLSITASNDRAWQPEVANAPWAEIDGNKVTFHNVRNFDYRTETDFTPVWTDRTYDLSKLDEADVLAAYWMGPDIAHIFVSFGFGGEDYLSVSIETRKEVGESYSTLAGFFRQYELYYVVADERDLVRVRTNYRKDPPEDVYVYRTNAPRENIRRVFLDYVREINSLRERAEFYNTLTTNCTTSIWLHSKVNPTSPPLSWKILASGHTPELLYELGRLDRSVPFAELQKLAHVNEAAQAADTAEDFSQRIRANVPRPPVAEK